MKKLILAALILFGLAGCENKKGAFIEEIPSQNDAPAAIAKLKKILDERGLTHFATIDHSENAKRVNMALKQNTVVLFGNPLTGTVLMQCNPSMGMDLPLKMLFTTSYEGQTTISYTNPEYWSLKHNIKDKNCLKLINELTKGMRDLAEEVAKR
ncbi:MAG: entry exclusion lipoprotein TrbK [Sulfurovum sp.]|nr:entry exclusion lipoprotein TrbK [Sulfurovum sp.]